MTTPSRETYQLNYRQRLVDLLTPSIDAVPENTAVSNRLTIAPTSDVIQLEKLAPRRERTFTEVRNINIKPAPIAPQVNNIFNKSVIPVIQPINSTTNG